MTSGLSRIVLMVRGEAGLIRAVNFYQLIGLTPERVTDTWAELRPAAPPAGPSSDGDPHPPSYSTTTRIHLQATATGNEAAVSTGYSPLLVFEVACDTLDATVARCLQAGAHLDGPLQYPAHGKVATMRTPDGHMIGLYEPTR
jgi:predicted enzyme related to lactoylglutathione lyase